MKNILCAILCLGILTTKAVATKSPVKPSPKSSEKYPSENYQKILHETPVLVVDAEASRLKMPSAFRSTKDTFSVKKVQKWVRENKKLPSRNGMDLISASASAQFSDLAFRNLVKVLGEEKKLYFIDLRLESHGFAGGHAVSLYGRHNAANRGMNITQSDQVEKDFLKEISKKSPAHIYKLIEKKEGEILKVIPLRIHPAPVQTEKELVESYGAEYRRFKTLDHGIPDIETMTAFSEFVKNLPEGTHLHFHCRGGRGRASQYMVYYDILKNAKKVDLQDILDRQYLIGNKQLQSISKSSYKAWKRKGAEDRLKQISYVYEFAKDPKGYGKCSWKEWLSFKGYDQKPPFALKTMVPQAD